MSLEKLLIFGFALAVMTSVVLLADNSETHRKEKASDWKTEMNKIAEKAK